MGFLRKVGRKIKKGVKKLFGSKLGRIVGMVGLYFAMGAIAKGLTGMFGQAATTTAEAAATTTAEAAATATAEAAATTGAEALTAAASNAEAANAAISAIETAASNGTLNTATTSITDAVSKTNMEIFKEGLGKIGQGIKDLPSKTGEFIADIPTKIAEAPGKAYEYLTGPDFMPDVAKGAATSYVTSAIVGEPEQPFYSRGVQQVGAMEAPQSAYVAEVQRQMPQMQGMDFNQLNQSLFYGTLSPQWLMSQAQYG